MERLLRCPCLQNRSYKPLQQ